MIKLTSQRIFSRLDIKNCSRCSSSHQFFKFLSIFVLNLLLGNYQILTSLYLPSTIDANGTLLSPRPVANISRVSPNDLYF